MTKSYPNLLVELGCEELPPRNLKKLAEAFYSGVCSGLSSAGFDIEPAAGSVLYSPRRMGFRLASVAGKQEDQVLDRKGPAVSAAFDADGNPTQAAIGFARSVGKLPEELGRQKTDKGEWLFCSIKQEGKNLQDVLFPILEKALNALPVAKPMRWSDHDFSFVRPVHWLVVLHGNEVLGGSLFGKNAGRETFGHRSIHIQLYGLDLGGPFPRRYFQPKNCIYRNPENSIKTPKKLDLGIC